MTADRFNRLWSQPWKDVARAATEGQHGSPSWAEAQAVLDGRVAEAQADMTAATKRLATATIVLAIGTAILAVATIVLAWKA